MKKGLNMFVFNNLSKPSISLYVYMKLSGKYHEDFQVHTKNYFTNKEWFVHQHVVQFHLYIVFVYPIEDAFPFFPFIK